MTIIVLPVTLFKLVWTHVKWAEELVSFCCSATIDDKEHWHPMYVYILWLGKK